MYNEAIWNGFAFGFLGVTLLIIIFIALAASIFTIIALWKVFVKANKPGWYSIVPIYNTIVLLDIVGLKWYYIFGYCLSGIPAIGPFISFVFNLVVSIKTSKSFGKEVGFGIGIAFLPMIFYAIIAFDKTTQYVGPAVNGDLDFNNLF